MSPFRLDQLIVFYQFLIKSRFPNIVLLNTLLRSTKSILFYNAGLNVNDYSKAVFTSDMFMKKDDAFGLDKYFPN